MQHLALFGSRQWIGGANECWVITTESCDNPWRQGLPAVPLFARPLVCLNSLSLSNGLLGNWVIGNFKEKGEKNKKTRWQHERTSIKADWRHVLFCSDGEHTSKIQHCHSVHFWALFSHCRRCDGNYQPERRCNFSSKGCAMFLILFKQSITTHTLPFCSDIDASLLFIFFF